MEIRFFKLFIKTFTHQETLVRQQHIACFLSCNTCTESFAVHIQPYIPFFKIYSVFALLYSSMLKYHNPVSSKEKSSLR